MVWLPIQVNASLRDLRNFIKTLFSMNSIGREKLKRDKIKFTIEWSILRKSRSYKTGDKACLLCLDEKLMIMENSKDPKLINKDLNIGGKCLHKSKFLINNWKK